MKCSLLDLYLPPHLNLVGLPPPPHLVVHDRPQTHDADVYVVPALAHVKPLDVSRGLLHPGVVV